MTSLSGRRVLVTGADGFIGSHLVERLLRDGAEVRALGLYNSFGSAGWLDDIDPSLQDALELRLGDIRDTELVHELATNVEIVFHLAALIAIPYSYVAPRSFIETNILGTLNVLEACRRAGVERLINTSTSEVYGTPELVPIVEGHTLKGQSPYSASKISAEKICEAFACSYEMPVVTLRPFNTYGPRQSARAIIPTILAQLLAGATHVRVGNLTPQRDFTYVSDSVDGFVRIATASLEPGAVVHLGTGEAISIGHLFDLCCKVVDSTATVVVDDNRLRPAGSEVEILMSDPSYARDILGWSPTVTLDDGLRRTADWLSGRVDSSRAARYQK